MRKSTPGGIDLIWTQPPPPPRQRALGRDEIVTAAIGVADESGLDAMTMKAVAARLGDYTPMALYRYVHNKDGLVDLMLDAAAAEIPLPAQPGPDWREDLRTLAMDSRRMIGRHPWFARLVHTRPPAGPHMMRRLEFMLAVLTRRGATVAAAMTYAALIDRHITGSGLQEAEEARIERRYGLDDSAKLFAALATLHELAAADGGLPHLTGWFAQPSGPTPAEQFTLGLGFLLDGIAGRLSSHAADGV
ncbi:TetR/AcrR family transcriptional regulator C-terminal domain-containing protein [Planotetraspora phitsanulokensis]|uniref:TetR family transcriptional regulator n=1 Tax=Planotetraspora phitsanulokensis TaxID=575192 RepID=A0A8J3UD02_9ACTN|nr:TetR/AcrR family transcriptional regulator C-terminal domain-containing protein [Planotetraspora phitsanulokensis]GII41382.1 TetR family transcriptional regulator [Planotetraspora phitsanulokensis]